MSEFPRRYSPETSAPAQREVRGLTVKGAVDQLCVHLGSYSNRALGFDLKKLSQREDQIGALARAYEADKRGGIPIELIDAIKQSYPERAPEGWHGIDALARQLSCSLDTLRPALAKWLTLKNIPLNALESRETWAPHAENFTGYIRFARELRGHQTFFFSPSMETELQNMLNESTREVTPRSSAFTTGRISLSERGPRLARTSQTPPPPERSSEQQLNDGLGIAQNTRERNITNLQTRISALLANRNVREQEQVQLNNFLSQLAPDPSSRDAQIIGETVRRLEADVKRRDRDD